MVVRSAPITFIDGLSNKKFIVTGARIDKKSGLRRGKTLFSRAGFGRPAAFRSVEKVPRRHCEPAGGEVQSFPLKMSFPRTREGGFTFEVQQVIPK